MIMDVIMRLCGAERRCFPACIVRKPVLSVVDLVNSETSSQVRNHTVLAKLVPVIAGPGNQQSFAKLKCQWAKEQQ
jgi:hypothetical protein